MTELVFSFFHCHPADHGVVITVRGNGRTRYRIIERTARCFSRWITVTAVFFRRAAAWIRARRTAMKMPGRARLTVCAGGLRL